MTNHQYLSVDQYDYKLDDRFIARYPLDNRSDSKLLYLPANAKPQNTLFAQLPNLLTAGDLIVFNDTKVMKARLFGQKDSGGKVEVLIERILNEEDYKQYKLNIHYSHANIALCHVKTSRALKIGQGLLLGEGAMHAKMIGRHENLFIIAFDEPILPNLEKYGELPIPPYFDRHADNIDNIRYQSVFHNPNKLASVAAPTASLHFDDAILKQLKQQGVNSAFVTLHVGAGTFAPVKSKNLLEHTMHSEYAHLPQRSADLINETQANGYQVIAVGTTVARVLESAYLKTAKKNNTLSSWSGDTDIFIYPGFEFKVIERLITNFHLPKSTLLMLVSAFSGKQNIEQAYAHAIKHHYRFFSYGDAMLLDKL